MSKLVKAASAALLMGIYGGAATHAEGEFSANVALTTDYVWRGVTQNDNEPAIQGGFDYANGPFYAGVWAANVAFAGTGANMELDLYAGLAGETAGGLGWDVGVIYYAYPGQGDTIVVDESGIGDTGDIDFVELYGGLSYEFDGGLSLAGSVNLDPDNETVYVDASAGFGLAENFSVDVGVGSYVDGGDDFVPEYTQFNVGGTYSIPDYFDVDLRFWTNDEDEALGDDRFVVTVSRSF